MWEGGSAGVSECLCRNDARMFVNTHTIDECLCQGIHINHISLSTR